MKIKTEMKNSILFYLFFGFFLLINFHINFLDLHIQQESYFFNSCYAEEYKMNTDVKSGTFDFMSPLLVGILQLFGLLINMAMQLIMVTFQDTFLNLIKNNAGIYTGWSVVRDILNLFFIFFLLYSAFCTIFQISRYHIKSTWVMIVVMALLVNFSWPITRVLIDASNLSMMYLIGDSGNVDGLTSKFGTETKFLQLMLGTNAKEGDTSGFFSLTSNKGTIVNATTPGFFSRVLFAILIAAIFLVTFLTVAILLILRIIVLAVLLVFAPVGYTLAAFPSTRSQSGSWWSMLMKQLITGPILIFCLLVSVTVLANTDFGSIKVTGSAAGGVQTVMKFIVSIILIWTGIMAAQKIGADGADMALGFANNAKNKMQGWGKKITVDGTIGVTKLTGRGIDSGANWASGKVAGLQGSNRLSRVAKNVGTMYDAARSAPQRVKNVREDMKDAAAKRQEAAVARGLAIGDWGGDKNALKKLHNKNVLATEKEIKEKGISSEDAIEKARTETDAAKRQAYLTHAMKSDEFGKDTAIHNEFVNLITKLKESNHLSDAEKNVMLNQMEKKYVEKGNGLHVMEARMARGDAGYDNINNAYQKMFANMNGKDLARQDSLLHFINQAGANNSALQMKLQQRFSNNAQLQQQFLENAGGANVTRAHRSGLV